MEYFVVDLVEYISGELFGVLVGLLICELLSFTNVWLSGTKGWSTTLHFFFKLLFCIHIFIVQKRAISKTAPTIPTMIKIINLCVILYVLSEVPPILISKYFFFFSKIMNNNL